MTAPAFEEHSISFTLADVHLEMHSEALTQHLGTLQTSSCIQASGDGILNSVLLLPVGVGNRHARRQKSRLHECCTTQIIEQSAQTQHCALKTGR